MIRRIGSLIGVISLLGILASETSDVVIEANRDSSYSAMDPLLVSGVESRFSSADSFRGGMLVDTTSVSVGNPVILESTFAGLTGNSGKTTGPHLHVSFRDGSRITKAIIDKYIEVDGNPPSNYRITSPYGETRGRTNPHRGIDFATHPGLKIHVKNGARVVGFRLPSQTRGGGYVVDLEVPHGEGYKGMSLVHLSPDTESYFK